MVFFSRGTINKMKLKKEEFQLLNQLDRIEYGVVLISITNKILIYLCPLLFFMLSFALSDSIFIRIFSFVFVIIYFVKIFKLEKKEFEALNNHFFELKPRGKR